VKWRALADALVARGIAPVWSSGPGEEALVDAIDPERRHRSLAGRLDLAQMWALLARARLLVAPDTGIPHLARIVGVPTVALFGPGSALVCGAGEFWRDMPYRPVTIDPFACRDQNVQYYRTIAWMQRCDRVPPACERPRCMEAIGVDAVLQAIDALNAEAQSSGSKGRPT
jgi:ADP-heptose:LPS heptosyltransferase